MSNRRKIRRLIGSVMAGAAPADVQIWETSVCAGCGRAVQFLPGQTVNVCAWCRTVVIRGVG